MAPTALVTGASGGIGRSIVRELGRDHDVVVHYHSDRESAAAVAEDVRGDGRDAIIHQCDVSDPDDVERMVDHARDELGEIGVLVNNAGVLRGARLETASDEAIQQTLRVNLEGAVYCARAVLPEMRDRGEGRIVNVSSTAGTDGSPTDVAYGASKSGLLGLTKSLAKQYTEDGIFANAVAPGPVRTEMFAEERRPATREASPIDRLVAPEEVAEVVRTFATTSAIAGETLVVDGGIRL
ncbi:SDR family NAD(P)-dependent oxidoreductase [Halopelagius longus]|uniref:3-oxoacyl-[acyl-carrier protein] reductase n=1 Tax=Halopelagius longus TaxID=1236180 RepID=A0A1H1B3X8_9EURY|nr:SDR family NAD(P)-dependent oxidoreductase [Halopelagius longus]RDI70630.1 SDR family NAD(P)-dependent oxidoreductase [Halopelagius longus]SDQ46627.1 3-oxoacyl-[acyl-carrier protein] reductase [Halopelagius longus]